MLDRIARFIKAHAMLPEGCTALVGVSGGMDSTALLRALCMLKDQLGIFVEAAHFNHGIRHASADEERFVAALCAELGVPLHTGRADVPALARERGVSLEVAAREARHAFFRQVMRERCISRLALAHHMDDQAETVLLRLFRGAGADGLAAMAPVEKNGIVRPLLCVGREDIRSWCTGNGFEWMEDASNADTSIPRNWVRHEMLPAVRANLNPAATAALCRAAELLAEDARCLNDLAEAALVKLECRADGGVAVPAEDLAGLPLAIRSRALRLLLKQVGLDKDVELVNIEDVDALLPQGNTGRRVDLGGGAVALREANMIVAAPALPSQEEYGPVALAVPGVTQACGGAFLCEVLPGPPDDFRNHPENVQYFDLDAFPKDVVARSRRDGDRFHPLGAAGGRKLKEYLIDRKVSRWSRDALPLLARGNDVLWVVGHGIADSVKISENTKRVLKITYTQEETGI